MSYRQSSSIRVFFLDDRETKTKKLDSSCCQLMYIEIRLCIFSCNNQREKKLYWKLCIVDWTFKTAVRNHGKISSGVS